jgi:hypothetical protein
MTRVENKIMARPDELPEGTDHIINGAMETGGGEAGDAGGPAGGASTGGGGASSGFIGASGGDGTGGTAAGSGGGGGGQLMATGTGGTGGSGGSGEDGGPGLGGQLREQVTALKGQAGERVRDFAESGKTRASDALEELSRVVAETAETIDERMGGQYGEYARKASDSVSTFADTLRRTDVDELYGNVQAAVRKSPAIAIGIAAVVGFTLARLIKAGMSDDERGSGTGGASDGRGA